MPMAAATSSAHLAAILFPTETRAPLCRARPGCGRRRGVWILTDRAQAAGIELVSLMPDLADFNDDLRQHGALALSERVIAQLHEPIARAFPSS
jgi:hypothetical protein